MHRMLIVNADDYGLTSGINRGILRAHREGIVTSASLMVCWTAAREAAALAGDLDLGLHIDLGEWSVQNGRWSAVYERVPQQNASMIEREIRKQLERFRRLTGANPTHLDSHQHVHRQEPTRSILVALADELRVPLRGVDDAAPATPIPPIRYCGDFYGHSHRAARVPEQISVQVLTALIRRLPAGITELGCHPGEDDDLDSMYCAERRMEVETLCDPAVREAVVCEGIRLCTFADVTRA